MAVISTGLLTRGLRGEFLNRLAMVSSEVANLATRIASTTQLELYKWLGSVPNMREWGNGRLAQGLRSESYTIENLKYEASIEVDRDEIEDDQLGHIKIRVQELAVRAGSHKDYLLAQLMANGHSAGYHSYDGVPFFGSTHASGASGTQDNDLTLNATDHTAVTPAEFLASFNQARAQMLGFKDDQGQPVNFSSGGLMAIVPPQLENVADTAMSAVMLNNTTNVQAGKAKVVCYPWLTDGAVWYLYKTDGVVKPFVFQDRRPLEFKALAEGSEEEFMREKYIYGVSARYRMAYGYWQHAVKTTFN